MTDVPRQNQEISSPSMTAQSRSTRSFRAVAERVAGRATNLFASGLVLILAVLLGREMLSAWASKSQSKHSAGTIEQPYRTLSPAIRSRNWMAFGDHSGTLMRSEVRGDAAAAMDQLRRDCRRVAGDTWHMPVRSTKRLHPWLKMLRENSPVERSPDKWALYGMQQPLPMIAALEDRNALVNDDLEDQIASDSWGIICWGLAIPSDAQPVAKATAWNSFVFSPARSKGLAGSMGIELPAGCERLVAIQDGDSLLAGFSSNVEPAELAARWDSCQLKDGWRAIGDWQVTGSAWHRRYEHSLGKSVDIQFAMEPHARILGFCLVSD